MRVYQSIIVCLSILIMNSMVSYAQTLVSKTYSINGDFQSIRLSSNVQLELSYTNGQPEAVIETEGWVHDNRYITVSASMSSGFDIILTSGINYPPIRVRLNYRRPLIGIEMSGSGLIMSNNKLVTDPGNLLTIAHSGTGIMNLDLDHRSNIDVAVSGTGRVTLSGKVHGNGRFSVSGIADVDAIHCEMKTVLIQMSGAGTSSVYGVEGVQIMMSGVGSICYRGPLISQVVSGPGTIGRCNFGTTTERIITEGIVTEGIVTEGIVTEGIVTEEVVTEEYEESSSMSHLLGHSRSRVFMVFIISSVIILFN